MLPKILTGAPLKIEIKHTPRMAGRELQELKTALEELDAYRPYIAEKDYQRLREALETKMEIQSAQIYNAENKVLYFTDKFTHSEERVRAALANVNYLLESISIDEMPGFFRILISEDYSQAAVYDPQDITQLKIHNLNPLMSSTAPATRHHRKLSGQPWQKKALKNDGVIYQHNVALLPNTPQPSFEQIKYMAGFIDGLNIMRKAEPEKYEKMVPEFGEVLQELKRKELVLTVSLSSTNTLSLADEIDRALHPDIENYLNKITMAEPRNGLFNIMINTSVSEVLLFEFYDRGQSISVQSVYNNNETPKNILQKGLSAGFDLKLVAQVRLNFNNLIKRKLARLRWLNSQPKKIQARYVQGSLKLYGPFPRKTHDVLLSKIYSQNIKLDNLPVELLETVCSPREINNVIKWYKQTGNKTEEFKQLCRERIFQDFYGPSSEADTPGFLQKNNGPRGLVYGPEELFANPAECAKYLFDKTVANMRHPASRSLIIKRIPDLLALSRYNPALAAKTIKKDFLDFLLADTHLSTDLELLKSLCDPADISALLDIAKKIPPQKSCPPVGYRDPFREIIVWALENICALGTDAIPFLKTIVTSADKFKNQELKTFALRSLDEIIRPLPGTVVFINNMHFDLSVELVFARLETTLYLMECMSDKFETYFIPAVFLLSAFRTKKEYEELKSVTMSIAQEKSLEILRKEKSRVRHLMAILFARESGPRELYGKEAIKILQEYNDPNDTAFLNALTENQSEKSIQNEGAEALSRLQAK
jgi:hypothetical protein